MALSEVFLTKPDFILKTKVKFFEKWVDDHGRRYFRKMALLIPELNDEARLFFNKWLPDTSEEHYELVALIPSVNSPSRLSIHRGGDQKSEKHYLFVMSKGVEEDLIKFFKEGDTVMVHVLPEEADEQADQMRDSDGNFDLVPGQEGL